jgi:acid stress-induced BolA-like protein IbaG/YrbA
MPKTNIDHDETLKESMENYIKLVTIKEDITPEQYQAIDHLRQLINEEFIGKDKMISSQTIYNMLEDIL